MIGAALLSLTAGPASACQACLTGGGMAPQGACSGAQGLVAAALLAGVAALGWHVARQADKESGLLKRAGQAIGWLLMVLGLGGFLCGALSHGYKRIAGAGACGSHGAPSMGGWDRPGQLPPGHPPLGEPPATPKR